MRLPNSRIGQTMRSRALLRLVPLLLMFVAAPLMGNSCNGSAANNNNAANNSNNGGGGGTGSTMPYGTAGHSNPEVDMLNQVLILVNQERANVGAGALLHMTLLSQAAKVQSDWLGNNYPNGNPPNEVGHSGPGGNDVSQRVTAQGVTNWTMVGENVAAGYTTPTAVMNGWMGSSGHRANILNTNYTHIGLAYSYGAPHPIYNHFWVQVFARIP